MFPPRPAASSEHPRRITISQAEAVAQAQLLAGTAFPSDVAAGLALAELAIARGKQLFGANALAVFVAYHQALPHAPTAPAKMLLIDQLIHAFHAGLTEPGRPAGANLIEGSLGTVIRFLDALTSAGTSTAGLGDSRTAWRRTLESAAWSQAFVDR